MDTSNSLVVGVVTGILTSTVLFLANQLFLKAFLPWYQQLTYRGVDFAGNYKCDIKFENDAGADTYILDLTQAAHNLSGTLTITQVRPTVPAVVGTFNVAGAVSDGCLQFLLTSVDRRRMSTGTALFVALGGKTLDGILSFREVANGTIVARKIVLARAL